MSDNVGEIREVEPAFGRERSRSPRGQSRSPRLQQQLLVDQGSMLPNPVQTNRIAEDVMPYSRMNCTQWTAKQVGRTNLGSPQVCIYDSNTRTAPRFCLYQGTECGTIVFALEPRKDGDKPAFITGAEPTRKVESLDLHITLEGQQLEFLQSVDDWVKKHAQDNAKDWFGRTCSETEIDVMYSSPIKVDEQGRYAASLRAKINLGGIDRHLTQVTFVRGNDVPEEGAGWEFVEPRLGEQKWRNHRARTVLEARRIWIVGKKFGLTYSITDIAVREKPTARPTPFANDQTVETLTALAST